MYGVLEARALGLKLPAPKVSNVSPQGVYRAERVMSPLRSDNWRGVFVPSGRE